MLVFAVVLEALGESLDEIELLLQFPKLGGTRVGGDSTAIELPGHLLAAES